MNMEFQEDQAASLRDGSPASDMPVMPTRTRCIAVASGKGGVGKTVVSVGLGCSLAKMQYRALILDADLGLANVDVQMGLEPTETIQDVAFGDSSFADAVLNVPGGPDVLPSSSGTPEMVDMGAARRKLFVNDLVKFAGSYDYLIVDLAAGIGDSVTSFLSAVPEVLLVVANEPTSVMDAYSLIKVLTRLENPPSVMMVVNMVRTIDEGKLLAARLNDIAMRFLGIEIPLAGVVLHDMSVGDAIRARVPVVNYAPKSAPASCLGELTKYIVSGHSYVGMGAKLGSEFFERLTDIEMGKGQR